MKKGDKVRFLSETGGGRVAAIKGNIVMVEDEDGFQIPTPLSDVVVVASENSYDTSNVINKRKHHVHCTVQNTEDEVDDDNNLNLEHTFRMPVEERKGGNVLNCFLGFVPVDVKSFATTSFESYFINDSNYYIRYNYLLAEGTIWNLHASGEVEPNTKAFIEEFSRETLNDYDRIAIQLIAYKRDKSFVLKPVVDIQFKIDKVKFYKLHTFVENDFFEQPALLYPIVENDKAARSFVVDVDKLKKEMFDTGLSAKQENIDNYVRRYDDGKKSKPFKNKRKNDEVLVVDLHIHELLETTKGMSNSDILNYQIGVFRKIMNEHKAHKGKRLIFIHGKGEGVLRQSILTELKYSYKNCIYQDASFLEYGYGATQVTIK